MAAQQGVKETVDYLILKEADITTRDYGDFTLIQCAARYGYLDIVKLAVESGANINQNNLND